VNQVFFLGLFLALLTNATAWTGAIVESFRSAGAAALRANGVAAGIAPSDIFDTGVNIAAKMLEALSITAPVQSLFVVLAALIILLGFALIAATIILALVESYIVLSAGVLLMGFGGSRWTKI
jgi:type IV secretion system protein TrbL